MSCNRIIMQGDSYLLPFRISLNGEPIDINEIEKIEFVVGNLKKIYINESPEIIYNSEERLFYFPITQQESIDMDGPQRVQVRIKDNSENVIGKVYGDIPIQFGESEEIL